MRVNIQATGFKIDPRRLNGRILAATRRAMLDAAKEFLIAAAPKVPIDTGMARGSFLNMVHLLESSGLGNVSDSVIGGVPTTPQRTLKNGKPLTYYHSGGGRYPKTPYTAQSKFSTQPDQILKKVGDMVVFSYKSDVDHYNANDEKLGWHSFRRGTEAFANKLRKFHPFDVTEYVIKISYITGNHASGYSSQSLQRTVK
jgi:hypothetical protein